MDEENQAKLDQTEENEEDEEDQIDLTQSDNFNENENERQAEEEDDDGEEADEEEEDDDDIRTFLEFTGSTDKERARLYLTATEGNLEEAVNLFLSGAPPPSVTSRHESSSHSHDGPGALPHLLAHLEALANGSSRVATNSGDGDDDDPQLQMDALLTDLSEHDVNLGALARSLMAGSGFSDFVRIPQEGNDDETYESNSTTDSEAKSRLDLLARGQQEVIPLIGAHTTRSVSSFLTYMRAGLIHSLCSALSRVSADNSIRILQVIESTLFMLCKDLNEAERLTIGWFLPPRRYASSQRRGRSKNAILEIFKEQIAPRGDLAMLRRVWRRRELEHTYTSSDGDSLLAIATSVKAPIDFIKYLVEQWGLDPKDAAGSLGSAQSIVDNIYTISVEKKEEDSWAHEVSEYFSSSVVPNVEEKVIEEKRLSSFPIPIYDIVPKDTCSETHWHDLTHSLLRFVSKSSNITAVRRALEILVLILEESPSKVPFKHPSWAPLISAALSPECKSRVVTRCALRMLQSLQRTDENDRVIIYLSRSGTVYRSMKRVWDAEEDSMLSKIVFEQIAKRVEGKCELDGRPKHVLEAVRALNSRSENAVSSLANALSDVTPFEFEQTNLAEAVQAYFDDSNTPSTALFETVPLGSSKYRKDSFTSEEYSETDELSFYFGNASNTIRPRRSSQGKSDHWKSDSAPKSKKNTILDRLVECAQNILSEAVPVSFPQIIHDFIGKEEGVRSLLNTLPLRLCPGGESESIGQMKEFSMHALPLTPRRELERQVLRCGVISNSRYIDYCKQLVGRKVVLSTHDFNELHLCTGFDFKYQSHRLKSMTTSQQHWRLLSLCKYFVLERVFDCDDSTEISSYDSEDLDCPENGAFRSAEVTLCDVIDEKQGKPKESRDRIPQGSPVAVWWEGSDELRPGWRLATVCSDLENEEMVKVSYPTMGLFFDDEIRIGSLVRLVNSEDLTSAQDLFQYVGEVARVTSIQGSQVTTNGFGGLPCNSVFLMKVRDPDDDGVSPKPQVGDTVGVISKDEAHFEKGTLISDDGSKVPFTVKESVSGEIRKLKEKDVFVLANTVVDEVIPTTRIVTISSIQRINQEHAFAVYIRPGSVANEVPDFHEISRATSKQADIYSQSIEDLSTRDYVEEEEEDTEVLKSDSASRFLLGARIEGRYAGKSRWYKGYISRVNMDGTYDLAYDDGDTERCVPPGYVAPAAVDSDDSKQSSSGPSSTPCLSLDFRKTFPTQAGRALFDALRREDNVLRSEYNFVTRGFEHQPNFYQTFAMTLERLGAGVFAQFQTFQQADSLYLRCTKFARESSVNDKVFIRYEPDRRAPATVIRDILMAFAKAEFQRSSSSSASQSSPPRPGSRALLKVGPESKIQSLREASKVNAWVSATVVSSYNEPAQITVVITDEGLLFRNVPADQLKEAPTRANTIHLQQPHSKRLSFRTGSSKSAQQSSNSEHRFDVPIELSRQFSVFGSNTTLRHISVSERSSSTIQSTLNNVPTNLENQPPKIFISFEAVVPTIKALNLIDEEADDDACVFRLVFETLFNDKKNMLKSNVLKAKWSFLSGLKLIWKTRVSFVGESDNNSTQGSQASNIIENEEKMKPTARDAFNLLCSLYKKSAGSNSVDWVNGSLSSHFRQQLKDPLSVASRVLPRWIQSFPSRAPFLFNEKDKVAYLRSATLGISRSIAWLQEDVTGYQSKKRELAQLTLELSQFFNQAEPNDAKVKKLTQMCDKLEDDIKQIKENRFIGQLRQDLVKVNRNNLLKDSFALMKQHAGERSELIVQFAGDTATGEGVTHEFYGAVAAELQKVETNRVCPMWADPSSTAKSSDHPDLIRPLGLFPHPLYPARNNKRASELNQLVIDRFRFLGRLMGQAFLDEKTVPIPLANEFFELLKEEDKSQCSPLKKRRSVVSVSRIVRLIESDDHSFVSFDIPSEANEAEEQPEDDENFSGIISSLSKLVKIIDDPSVSQSARDSALSHLEHRLEELGLRFVDPSQPKVDSELTSSNELNNKSHSADSPCLVAPETEIFDNVPLADAPYPAVLAFANEWSQKGKTKQQIERALESAGHSKIARWRVLQATQATRVVNATNEAEERLNPLAELIPDGRFTHIDAKNVREYITAVEKHWTGTGIRPQIQATRLGLIDSLGERGALTLLRWFPADSLSRMFCGEQEVKWNDNDPLLGFLLPKGEYVSSSPEIRMLVESLQKMTPTERSQFLSFCTALPRVPSSGLPQVKVFPPTKSRVTALILNLPGEKIASDSRQPQLAVGDKVKLAPGYETIEDAAHGPLRPGEIGEVTNFIMRARVNDWWYHPRALIKVDPDEEEGVNEEETAEEELQEEETTESSQKEETTQLIPAQSPLPVPLQQSAEVEENAKTFWFTEGDIVKSAETTGTVSVWDKITNTLHLKESSSNRDFRSGKRLTLLKPVSERPDSYPSSFLIKSVVEECEIVQSPPFLRPKATTCVMTLYLPTGYRNSDHMLEVFREAFDDAKLAGIQDA